MTKKYLSGEWRLYNKENDITANVPGDISDALLNAGIIDDPYYGYNANDCMWIVQSDWTYEKEFTLDDHTSDEIHLCFEGIDTFAKVYLNGVAIGETSNMHRLYEFDVTDHIKSGKNLLQVEMLNVFDKFGKNSDKKYCSIFNDERVFIRKAQCHFGWDWAPKLPGYGIYRDVYIKYRKHGELAETSVSATNDGSVTFRLNFEERFEGEVEIDVYLDGDKKASVTDEVNCKRKLLNLFVEEPSLWWPNGYGDQPLYEYTIVQRKGGEIYSETTGRFAFREVEINQQCRNATSNHFAIRVNGRDIFAKGSNWVPADCMTGRITDDKYEALITATRDANFNILRVWGGGIYEKDCFYNLCDEYGILIWQDFMFACSDIPEDDFEFVSEITKEAEYQVKRLRNHPCIALFCGENEVTGTFTSEVDEKYSVFTLHYLLRGICGDLAPDVPYVRCSPFAFADTDNDVCEGDAHNNLSEICLFSASFKGFDSYNYSAMDSEEKMALKVKNYENFVEETKSNFSSECAIIGAVNYSSLLKFTPQEEIGLQSEFFKRRFLGNPYTYVMPDFFDRQKAIAKAAFGEIADAKDLFKKANRMQSDIMKTEILFARCNGDSAGFMNWMYNDIWPTGTWSVIDYYLSKKPAYYQMKRCFVQRGALLVRVGSDYYIALMNDDRDKAVLRANIRYCDYAGNVLSEYAITEEIDEYSSKLVKIANPTSDCDYAHLCGSLADIDVSDTYDFNRYSEKFYTPDFTSVIEDNQDHIAVTISAKTFVPIVAIMGVDTALVEDNFFEMAAGETRTIKVFTDAPRDISVKSFFDEWDQ